MVSNGANELESLVDEHDELEVSLGEHLGHCGRVSGHPCECNNQRYNALYSLFTKFTADTLVSRRKKTKSERGIDTLLSLELRD